MKPNLTAEDAGGDPVAARAIDRLREPEREAQAAVAACERAGSKAHAGLAAGISALCAGTRTRWRAILGLVLGNDLLIVIECLVVGFQTTGLLLFEFFIRFKHQCKGTGRYHGPISSPPSSWANSTRVSRPS